MLSLLRNARPAVTFLQLHLHLLHLHLLYLGWERGYQHPVVRPVLYLVGIDYYNGLGIAQ